MIYSTQCYIIKDGQWLMLYRNRKKNDVNEGKWIGVGGKLEPDETPEQCTIREVKEETYLDVNALNFKGVVYFNLDSCNEEKIWVYTCTDFEGSVGDCNEGELHWICEHDILNLSLWEGDRIFLEKMMMNEEKPFCLQLIYDAEGNLTETKELGAECL